MLVNQTAEQKKRERLLDEDWIEDLAFVFTNIHSCEELEHIWNDWWNQCPLCGAEVKKDGTIVHIKQ